MDMSCGKVSEDARGEGNCLGAVTTRRLHAVNMLGTRLCRGSSQEGDHENLFTYKTDDRHRRDLPGRLDTLPDRCGSALRPRAAEESMRCHLGRTRREHFGAGSIHRNQPPGFVVRRRVLTTCT